MRAVYIRSGLTFCFGPFLPIRPNIEACLSFYFVPIYLRIRSYVHIYAIENTLNILYRED